MPAIVTQESRLAAEPQAAKIDGKTRIGRDGPARRRAVERQAFTIDEFAEAYRISRATVYNMWRAGTGPPKMRVLGRVLISRDAAEKWRAQMEADSGSAK